LIRYLYKFIRKKNIYINNFEDANELNFIPLKIKLNQTLLLVMRIGFAIDKIFFD